MLSKLKQREKEKMTCEKNKYIRYSFLTLEIHQMDGHHIGGRELVCHCNRHIFVLPPHRGVLPFSIAGIVDCH